MVRSFTALVSISFISSVLAEQCIWKNGQAANDYYACDPTAAQSSCCLQGEACVANGLCYGSLGQIYRGACAGGWGNDTACPDQCNDQGGDGGWSNLFLCPEVTPPSGASSWWCGDSSKVVPCDVSGTSAHPTEASLFSLPGFGMLPSAIMPLTSKNFTGCAVSQSNAYSLTKQLVNETKSDSGSGNTTVCSCPAVVPGNSTCSGASTTTTSNAKQCPNGTQIGEGVAIGVLALLLAAALGWGFWERKQKNRMMTNVAPAPYQSSQPYYQDHQIDPVPTKQEYLAAEMPTYNKAPNMHELRG